MSILGAKFSFWSALNANISYYECLYIINSVNTSNRGTSELKIYDWTKFKLSALNANISCYECLYIINSVNTSNRGTSELKIYDWTKFKFKQLTTISNFPTSQSPVQHVCLLCFAKYRKSISLQRDARKCFVTAQGKLLLIESSLQEQVIIRDDLKTAEVRCFRT